MNVRKYVLVVIDLQIDFMGDNAFGILPNVISEIEKAIRLNNHIMILSFDGCGRLYEDIFSATKGYSKLFKLKKSRRDGSDKILQCLDKNNLLNKVHLKFCGVNTDQCVKETVESLVASGLHKYRVELLEKACASGHNENHLSAIREMGLNKLIQIV